MVGATQNAGYDKKNPLNGSWNYREVIREFDRQSGRKNVTIQIGGNL